MEGIILKFSDHNGQIKGDDGKTYSFNQKAIKEGDVAQAEPGRRVSFQDARDPVQGKDRARDVILLKDVIPFLDEPKAKDPPPTNPNAPYRFLNPYNFVRHLEAQHPDKEPLLGRCSPPPHDRYIGLTGRITCQLTATTPIFTSDSHEIIEERVGGGKIHRHYQFFRDPQGTVAIPATTVRGCVRSIFEAATNSCFAHFAGEKRLSYHLPPGDAMKLVPGRVRKVDNTKWELDLLPGTTPISPLQRPTGPQYAAWVNTYRPLWASRSSVKAPTSRYAARTRLSLAGWKHGEECQALIELVEHPLKRFEFWNVISLTKPGALSPVPVGTQRIVNGFLSINNQNIENKHDERVFFSSGPLRAIDLPKDASRSYEELIADYQDRHKSDVKKRSDPASTQGTAPAYSRFVIERTGTRQEKLRHGDLVYAMLENRPNGFAVKFIVPVSVPRVSYKRMLRQLLPQDVLEKCSSYDKLCPACRVFGWVEGNDSDSARELPLSVRTAYAGRVRFSHAPLVKDAGQHEPITLAILSTPKPTTSRFYLRPKTGKPRSGLDDYQVNYDAETQILRGRKIYRHQGDRLNPQEYQSVGDTKSDQNRTLHGVQKVGSVFEFEVNFENLSKLELGMLLWSLELNGWNHRVGLGKPLGLGSAKIKVMQLRMLDTEARYTAQSNEEMGWSNQVASMESLVADFKNAMKANYGASFEQLANIRDLQILLSNSPRLPVHYPRPSQSPLVDGRQYEWFVGNSRSGQDAGPRLVLPLADEDKDGFPLLDKYGE